MRCQEWTILDYSGTFEEGYEIIHGTYINYPKVKYSYAWRFYVTERRNWAAQFTEIQ